ncbi:hypothetical protein QAD02_010060 [Eretmocerus hayati]|uniref:Uncharacterized protein n=1 Tax=Eretmocerus hayati TaxID=131215 RepID=A0ACC2NDK0_9HYME|nr:hypothetical protein QAD02_010060 [Eretmocerus hayati]
MSSSNLIPWLLTTYITLYGLLEIQGSTYEQERSVRSVEGFDSLSNSYPYMASVRYAGRPICGGTIISPNVILTTAGCIPENYFLDLFYVKVGDSDINHKGSWHQVAQVLQHEGYTKSKILEETNTYERLNDIALLKLEKPIEIDNRTTRRIELFKESDDVHDHNLGSLIGWGMYPTFVNSSISNSKSNETKTSKRVVILRYPAELKYLELNIASMQNCSDFYPSANLTKQFCTYTLGEVPCSGDIGSPLVVNGKQAGIVSWGSKKCHTNANLGYFTEVAKFEKWINEKIKSL